MVKEIVLLAAGEAIPDDFARLWKEKMTSCNERKVSGNNGGKNTAEKETAEKTELQRTNSATLTVEKNRDNKSADNRSTPVEKPILLTKEAKKTDPKIPNQLEGKEKDVKKGSDLNVADIKSTEIVKTIFLTSRAVENEAIGSMGSGTNEAGKKSNESTKTDSQCSRVLEKDKVNQTDPVAVAEPIMPSSTSQKKRKTSKHGLQRATKTARISSTFSSAKEASGSEEDLHRSV
jgi:hypothetical protein